VVSSVSSSTSSSLTGLASAATGGQELGQDAFLQLLVEQIKNQDPLNPQDNTQFVAQLAQFSSLEQSMGINDRLDSVILQNTGMQNAQVVSLVGKDATVKGGMVTIDGTGTGSKLNFELGSAAAGVKVTITDQYGNTVRTIDVGEKKAGVATVSWDGRSAAGLVQPKGTYQVAVTAKTEDGTAVTVDQETTSEVTAVSFDKGYPVLHLENGISVPISDLVQVESSSI
jgi:flagellar basal-body rod modification protein FlgD